MPPGFSEGHDMCFLSNAHDGELMLCHYKTSDQNLWPAVLEGLRSASAGQMLTTGLYATAMQSATSYCIQQGPHQSSATACIPSISPEIGK